MGFENGSEAIPIMIPSSLFSVLLILILHSYTMLESFNAFSMKAYPYPGFTKRFSQFKQLAIIRLVHKVHVHYRFSDRLESRKANAECSKCGEPCPNPSCKSELPSIVTP